MKADKNKGGRMGESQQNTAMMMLEKLEKYDAAGDKQACISICNELLKIIDRQRFPELWASIQGMLADNLRTNPADPLNGPEQSISHYRLALEIFNEKEHSLQWAANNGNLGNIFMERKKGVGKDNIKQAIPYFIAALKVYDQDPNSLDAAMTHASLGEAFDRLGDHSSKVVDHFEAALSALSISTHPKTCLKAHLALGEEYSKKGPAGMNKAVEHLQEATKLFPAEDHFHFGYLNEKLGHCFRESTYGLTAIGQEQTIHAFKAALQAYLAGGIIDGATRARVQLGECYAHRIRGVKAENIQKAIQYLEAALKKSKASDPAWPYLNTILGKLYEDAALQ